MVTALATALTTWEAVLDDGTIVREGDGTKYEHLALDRLEVFRLVYEGQTLFATERPIGAPGTAFRYRRRGVPSTGENLIVLGWSPHGPAFLVDPTALDDDRVGVWVAGKGFHADSACACEQPHPLGWFDEPAPFGGER